MEGPEQPALSLQEQEQQGRAIVAAPGWMKLLALSFTVVAAACCVGVVGALFCQRRRAQKRRVYARDREPPPIPAKAKGLSRAHPELGLNFDPGRAPGPVCTHDLVRVPGTSDRYGDSVFSVALRPAQAERRPGGEELTASQQSEELLRITQGQAMDAEQRRQQQIALQDTLRRTQDTLRQNGVARLKDRDG